MIPQLTLVFVIITTEDRRRLTADKTRKTADGRLLYRMVFVLAYFVLVFVPAVRVRYLTFFF